MNDAEPIIPQALFSVENERNSHIKLLDALKGEARRTAKLTAELPRGITLGYRTDGRGKPWFLRFGPDRKIESFATERLRNDRADTLAAGVVQTGAGAFDFDAVKWRELQAFERDLGMSLAEAREIIAQVRGNLRLNLTVAEAIDRYKALRAHEGLQGDSLIHTRLHLKRFAANLGPLPLFSISATHLRDWLYGREGEDGKRVPALLHLRGKHRGQPVGALSLRHHLKTVRVFFARAKAEKWCLENPAEVVSDPKVPEKDVTVLSARQIFDLLRVNRDHPVVGRMALELFGGLRCSSVERIAAEHIDTAARGIVMPGRAHKSGKRKYRQGQPGVLWDWLAHAGPAMFTEITGKNYDEQKRDAFVRAGVPAPHNVLRHSFASYLAASTGNLATVSYQMQHTSLAMTGRYEGVATARDAGLVFAMTPAAVLLGWDAFSLNFPVPAPNKPA